MSTDVHTHIHKCLHTRHLYCMIIDSHFLVLYFMKLPGRMTRAVTLLFVLIGSIVERSSAVSCYSCKERTCPDPFRAASVPTCNGAVCELLYRVAYLPSSGEQCKPTEFSTCL